MTNQIQPYRTIALVEKPKGKVTGLIVPPKPPKPPKLPTPHECNKPSIGWHLFGPNIVENSIWRCDKCKTVWLVVVESYNFNLGRCEWKLSIVEEWIKAGGVKE